MMDLKILKYLCTSNGISGNETNIRNFILSEIKNYVDNYKIDNLGNLIAFKKGTKKNNSKLLISAHMDEVGLIVTHITKDGFIKFTNVGGIDSSVLHAKSVKIGENHLNGVIGTRPIHLCTEDEKNKSISISDMYIDIGAKDREQALKHVKPGDSIYFDSVFNETNDSIKSKALDDRAGCFLLMDLIKKDITYDTFFSFVVQEEVGLRGATVAAYNVNPDFAIVVEATTASDIPDVCEHKTVCKLGNGAVIPFMDKATIYDKDLFDLAMKISDDFNIKVQTKNVIAGGNDAGAIHVSRGGTKTISVSLPCRYLHSAASIINKDDLLSARDILYRLALEIPSKFNV